jgi:hypothetical protein
MRAIPETANSHVLLGTALEDSFTIIALIHIRCALPFRCLYFAFSSPVYLRAFLSELLVT